MLVMSLTGLARFFRLSEYLVAFIFMSSATSIPELFVGISSAVNGVPNLSLGNLLGANLLNMTVVIGLVALLSRGLEIESKISRENFWLIFILSLFPLLLGFDGIISRADGLILIVSFSIYIWHILGEKEYFSKIVNHRPTGLSGFKETINNLLFFLLGVGLLIVSSWVLVWSGTQLAKTMSLGLLPFGALFVALGTTLPEIVFGVRAAIRQHPSLAAGNSLGSVAFNAAFIVGLVSLIEPIVIKNVSQFFFVTGAFIAAFMIFNLAIFRKTIVSRRTGLVLVAVYFIFFALELFSKIY